MTKRIIHSLLVVLAVIVAAGPVQAQRNNEQDRPKRMTRAQKAKKLFSDATSLWQTGRGDEAAPMFESLAKRYPTSELVPEALAQAVRYYAFSGREREALKTLATLERNFPNNRHTLSAQWARIERATRRETDVPVKDQIALLEEYLDRYWAQAHFLTAMEKLSSCLLKAKQIEQLDAFLSHCLSETNADGMGGMINMIQRACGRREDYENMARIYGNAVENIDPEAPASMAVRLLNIRYLKQAGDFAEALKKTEQIIRERPKSAHAAYCALEMKPALLADSKKPGEAASQLEAALQTYSIFSLKRHRNTLAGYQADAGDFRKAIATLTDLLAQPHWPYRKKELLEERHGYELKAGDPDAANATNAEIARLFPETRVTLQAALRSVRNLIDAERFDEAREKLSAFIAAHEKDPDVAGMAHGFLDDFADEVVVKALREEFIEHFPASDEAQEVRKELKVELKGTPTEQAKALHEEYRSFAEENNVPAARRRIEKLFEEYPSSGYGA